MGNLKIKYIFHITVNYIIYSLTAPSESFIALLSIAMQFLHIKPYFIKLNDMLSISLFPQFIHPFTHGAYPKIERSLISNTVITYKIGLLELEIIYKEFKSFSISMDGCFPAKYHLLYPSYAAISQLLNAVSYIIEWLNNITAINRIHFFSFKKHKIAIA